MNTGSGFDLIIVGGGLSGSLLAWRLKQRRPDLKVCLIEKDSHLGGNHTWSFFASDLTPEQNAWLAPLVEHSWPSYEVRFPKRTRQLPSGYRTIPSEKMAAVVSASLGTGILAGADVVSLDAHKVVLADQRTLTARCVIDARGGRADPNLVLGFQKFLGLEVRVAKPHGVTVPIIMDATVAQNDGYRFVYTLPLAPDRLLIEDTYYSDGVDMAPEALRARLTDYAEKHGWQITETIREETGVLPIILAGDVDKFLASDQTGAPRIGLGAGLFHPTTGYSLPDAVRLADTLADQFASHGAIDTDVARGLIHGVIRDAWAKRSIFRMLNRMLFKAGQPHRRYVILERFYGLDAGLIRSFYAGHLSLLHKARILIGKPPVPIQDALRCVSERDLLRRSLLEPSKGA